jgi:hypothetical protein
VYGVIWVGLLASLVALSFASTLVAAQQPEKPNVVFFLADNVGYGDLGPYGGGELRGAPTPRIDQLARDGLRLGNQGLSEECVGFAEFRAPLGEARPQRPRPLGRGRGASVMDPAERSAAYDPVVTSTRSSGATATEVTLPPRV